MSPVAHQSGESGGGCGQRYKKRLATWFPEKRYGGMTRRKFIQDAVWLVRRFELHGGEGGGLIAPLHAISQLCSAIESGNLFGAVRSSRSESTITM